MEQIIAFTAQLIKAGKRTWERKWHFFALSAAVFVGSVLILAKLDLLPEASREAQASVATPANEVATDTSSPIGIEDPMKIEIKKINLAVTVDNPTTTDVEVLDKSLLKGAVRYPTSARLNQAGNVVLFGHSSYLPVVGNPAYKTFDGIQKLVAGDSIIVYSSTTVYTYKVRSMEKQSAASDAGIALVGPDRVLTLSTCNSFGAKTDRFIVTADFVESHSIAI